MFRLSRNQRIELVTNCAHKELAHKLAELERKFEKHDQEIIAIFEAIRELMAPPPVKEKRIIGFHP